MEDDEAKVLKALYDGIYRVGFSIAWPYTHASMNGNHARLNAEAPKAQPKDRSLVLPFQSEAAPKRRFEVVDGGAAA